MNKIHWPFLWMAIAAVASIMGIGIAIGYRSTLGMLTSVVALILVMGFGFMLKKKIRESGKF